MYVRPISRLFSRGRLTPAMRATYPCLCLCRGFVQMTMVRPCRLITRQRSHIGLTDGRTFISSMPEGDPASGEVVRGELHLDAVSRKDADVVLAHLPGDLREHLMPLVDLDAEHRARQGLHDLAFHLDLLFLLGHTSTRQPRSTSAVLDEQRTRRNAASAERKIVANPRFLTGCGSRPAKPGSAAA